MNKESITTYTGRLSVNGTSGMSFFKHSSYKLTIAITAVLLTQHQPALAKQGDWNCLLENGSWDCSSTITTKPTPNKNTQAAAPEKISTEIDENNFLPPQLPVLSKPAEKAPSKNIIQDTPIATETAPALITTQAKPRVEAQKNNKPVEQELAKDEIPKVARLSDSSFTHLDWYPYPKGDNTLSHCSGRYIEPPLPEDDGTPFDLKPIIADALEAHTELGQGTALSGSVKITQGSRSLYSNSATINKETGLINLTGGATYREPGLLFTGKNAQSNTSSQITTLNDAQYVLYKNSIRGSVAQISRNEDKTISIDTGTYTQCPPTSDTWEISAKKIKIDQTKGFGLAESATLRLSGVPVLYVPYFRFPIDDRRQSGFLYPSIRYTESEGLNIDTPYYFNIAENMDDTLTPRFFEKRGILLENEFRHLNSYSKNTLSTSYLSGDNLTHKDRWLLGMHHTGTPTENWVSNINYLHVSDNDYFDDLGTKLSVSEVVHLNRSGSLTYYGNQWQTELLLQSYQTIDDDNTTPYRRLPQIQVSGTPALEQEWLEASYFVQLTQFDRNLSGLTGSDRITGTRLHIEPEITTIIRNDSGYIKPSVKAWLSQYSLNNQVNGLSDSPSLSVPIISIDSGLFFERDFTLLNNNYQQTLEPRFFALYVPEHDQSAIPDFDTTEHSFDYASLFRNNRFSGHDRIGDTKQLSLGLTSRLIDQKGREAVSASVGQAIYFEDRVVSLSNTISTDSTSKYSDIATRVNWRPNERMNITFNANFNHEEIRNTENNLAVRYQEDINRLINLSYRFSEDIREQSTASFIWPVSKNWSTLGVWQYDWRTNDNIDLAFGLEYESCCWKTRVITRQWLKDNDEKDTALYLQFILKGLGSFGSSGESDFIEKITGFEQREETNDQF